MGNPFKSEWTEDEKGHWFWNHRSEKLLGPMSQEAKDRFLAYSADVIQLDDGIQKLRGPNQAQVFRNHRSLRQKGLIVNGVYKHNKKQQGGPQAA